jgi:hypothetical protein
MKLCSSPRITVCVRFLVTIVRAAIIDVIWNTINIYHDFALKMDNPLTSLGTNGEMLAVILMPNFVTKIFLLGSFGMQNSSPSLVHKTGL